MATRWLLLLLVVSTQSVVSQPTTGSDARGVAEHQGDIEKMLLENQQKILDILKPHQPGKLSATTFSHNFRIYLFQLQALTRGRANT